MPLEGFNNIGAGKLAFEWQSVDIERIHRKHIAMHDRIIPGWAWPIVAVIVAIHVAIAGKPTGVIVYTMAHIARCCWPRLTARSYTTRKLAFSDFVYRRIDID